MITSYDLLIFDTDTIEDIIIYKSLDKFVEDRKKLYTSVKFNFHSVPLENFKYIFRFEKNDIIKLYEALQLPNRFETSDQHVIDGKS